MTTPARPAAARSAPKNRPTEISRARKAAFRILLAVERGHSHSDDLLRGKDVNALSPPDRNLATALVLGVLRWQILLDHQIQKLLARPGARLDAEIQIALRLAAFQILHMDRIPARAAIDESVELAKQAGQRFASGMVNAVLRRLAAGAREATAETDPQALALARAHPAWLVERWVNRFGMETAAAICQHGQTQAPVTIRLADDNMDSNLAMDALELHPGEILRAARTVTLADVAASASFREGRIRIQDEGSQLVAEIAARALNRPAERILDACAAPGGKTLILAERNPQAHIVACEASASRMEQLRRRLAPLGDRVEFRSGDASQLSDDAAFDLVLADVPCSGTGTLGRNPEIRHRLRAEDLPRHAERQRAILATALRAVRPGGRVVYSTCSLESEENEQVVAGVLASAGNARPIRLQQPIDDLAEHGIVHPGITARLHHAITPEGALRLIPGTFQSDGFFIAMLERTPER